MQTKRRLEAWNKILITNINNKGTGFVLATQHFSILMQQCKVYKLRKQNYERKMFGLDYVYVNLILVSISTALKCGSVEDIGQILLSESYVTCQSLNLKQDRAICEIYSAEDEYNLVCLGLSNCKMPVTLCPDGNINKTCFPLRDDNSLSYQCICHSKRRAEAIVPVTEWTPWTISTNPYQAFTSERSLIVPSQEWTVLH